MSSRNDKFRNPSAPLGHIKKKPEIVVKTGSDVQSIDIDKLIALIIESGICDEPDVSVYDHFTINPSSDDDDITEVPVVKIPKKVEVVDIEEGELLQESEDDIKIVIKKEVNSPELHVFTETSDDVEQGSKASTSAKHTTIPVNTELCIDKSEKIAEDKKSQNHDQSYKKSSRRKKIKERKDSCKSESDSVSRSRHKRRESSECGSDSDSRGRHKRDDVDSRYCSKKRLPKRYDAEKNYDSDSNSYKRKLKREYSSDESESSSVRAVRRKRTPSPCSSREYYNEEYEKARNTSIKQEEQSGSLFGQHLCEICNLTLNSYATYQSHVNGKRHLKALNSQTTSVRTFDRLEVGSRYPKSPAGYHREKMDGEANIQVVLNQGLRLPCPGLDNITEIHSVGETIYFCSFCNSPCGASSILPHLNGFKHQLNCLKHYKNELYLKWNYLPKYKIEERVADVLGDIELKIGRGVVRVERDVKVTDWTEATYETASRNDPNRPSTSTHSSDYTDIYISYSFPDPTKSGYYCKLCDSHSNSEAMWQNHIVGKRHLANLKKAPGTAPTKSKYIPASSNVHPLLFDLLDRHNPHKAPVVGLDQIREIRKPDIDGVSYNCFLCSACISSFEIVDHILSKKHREKYLNSIKHPDLDVLKSCHMSETSTISIIEEICVNVEAERGSGVPEVYYAKNAVLRG